jgi:pimeloyl-ACP methyl ester carboxylesterase
MNDELPDAELLRCAQNGDVAALGVLLQRHQAPMRAVALSVLGHGPDTEDAPRWAEELRKGIPGARLVVLERSGHFGHLEQPAEFARAVADFVRDTAG